MSVNKCYVYDEDLDLQESAFFLVMFCFLNVNVKLTLKKGQACLKAQTYEDYNTFLLTAPSLECLNVCSGLFRQCLFLSAKCQRHNRAEQKSTEVSRSPSSNFSEHWI